MRLTLSLSTTNDAGNYSVTVSNSYGIVTSSVAALTVLTLHQPPIFSQPASLAVTIGSPASFSVGAAGSAPLSFQWQINGTNLADGAMSRLVRQHFVLERRRVE